MMYFIAFIIGVLVGMILLSVAQIRKMKTHDLMMVDGKVKWVNRIDRYIQERKK